MPIRDSILFILNHFSIYSFGCVLFSFRWKSMLYFGGKRIMIRYQLYITSETHLDQWIYWNEHRKLDEKKIRFYWPFDIIRLTKRYIYIMRVNVSSAHEQKNKMKLTVCIEILTLWYIKHRLIPLDSYFFLIKKNGFQVNGHQSVSHDLVCSIIMKMILLPINRIICLNDFRFFTIIIIW